LVEFRELGLREETLRGLATMGFEAPTPVQERAIPCLLEGRDVIAQALTGTGKTAAFGVPIVERIDPTRAHPQAIVLTPTRELAIQVTDQLCKIGQHRHIAVLPIYGGQPIGRQLATLRRGVHAIVATPGRLLDHMRRGSVDLSGVRTLILDEADQMLEMGFIEDVEYVLEHLPTERATALFSATMPKPIVDLAKKHLRDPEMIVLARPRGLTVPDIEQVFYLVPFPRKLDALCRVLDVRQPERAIVFCATKRMVDEVVEGLTARGYPAEALHGDISQAMRERVLRAFRSGQFEVLVATDVAARGLDVPEVSHVVNFDIPPDPEYYVHRIGRTGRFGRRGEAITFVNPREMRVLKVIERVTGAHIRREEVPTAAEAEEREVEMLEARLLATLGKGGWGRYRPVIEELLLEDHDPVDLAAAALALLASSGAGTRRAGRQPISLVSPRPTHEAREPSKRPARAGAVETRRPARDGREADDEPRPRREPAGARRQPRDASPNETRPRRDRTADRPAPERASPERRTGAPPSADDGKRRDRADTTDSGKRRERASDAGRADGGTLPDWAARWGPNEAPSRKPRRLVTGPKGWERRPKPGAPPSRGTRPKRPR
jgi:ATP-dependent RNA helicase DeaD